MGYAVIGEVLDGKYEILRLIGEGGMGAVYEAEHLGMGRRVAVKIILARDLQKKKAHIKRFHREARAAGCVDSRHIAQILDTGTLGDGRPFMVMELLGGEDLGQLLKRVGPLRPEVATAIVAQACRGLDKAHAAGVIHRDLKPANVFLAERDGEIEVKLIDFGIAKLDDDLEGFQDSTLTKTGSLLGSPLYMSPEQARGKRAIDHRADLWSMGVVLYRSLSGRTPFQEIDALGDLIITICSTPVPPIQDFAPWVPGDIAEVLHRALKLKPDARFQAAREMGEALSAVITTTRLLPDDLVGIDEEDRNKRGTRVEVQDEPPTLSATSAGLSTSQTSSGSSSRSLMLVAVGAGIALGAVGLYTLSQGDAARGAARGGAVSPSGTPSGGATGTTGADAAPKASRAGAGRRGSGGANVGGAGARGGNGGADGIRGNVAASSAPPPAAPPTLLPPPPPPRTKLLPTPDDEEFGGRK